MAPRFKIPDRPVTAPLPGDLPSMIARERRISGVNLRDAILAAAREVGQDGQGTGELKGYLKLLAIQFPQSFATLLAKVLPYNIRQEVSITHYRTKDEVIAELKARGIPVEKIFH